MEQRKHNPHYKLVETTVFEDNVFKTLVLGITNDGTNKGMEIYFKRERDGHHYKSFRYSKESLPKKYLVYWDGLDIHLPSVQDGYKLSF